VSPALFVVTLVVLGLLLLPVRNRWFRFLSDARASSWGFVTMAAVVAALVLLMGRPQDRWLLGLSLVYLILAVIARRRT